MPATCPRLGDGGRSGACLPEREVRSWPENKNGAARRRSACNWRRRSESNRRTRLCRPLHNHSATPPGDVLLDCIRIQPMLPERILRQTACGDSTQTKREALLPFGDWSGRRVSNSRPQPWQGCALPTELLPHTTFTASPASCEHAAGPSLTWSGRRVSNSRPQPWQGCALPTELLPQGHYRNPTKVIYAATRCYLTTSCAKPTLSRCFRLRRQQRE